MTLNEWTAAYVASGRFAADDPPAAFAELNVILTSGPSRDEHALALSILVAIISGAPPPLLGSSMVQSTLTTLKSWGKEAARVHAGESRFFCLTSSTGTCALQRQGVHNAVTSGMCIEGVWALCGQWLTSRSSPKRLRPSCPKCQSILTSHGQLE